MWVSNEAEQEAMMGLEDSYQRLLQLSSLRLQTPSGQISQDGWISLSSEHGFQHSPRRLAQDICGHITELDIGIF